MLVVLVHVVCYIMLGVFCGVCVCYIVWYVMRVGMKHKSYEQPLNVLWHSTRTDTMCHKLARQKALFEAI